MFRARVCIPASCMAIVYFARQIYVPGTKTQRVAAPSRNYNVMFMYSNVKWSRTVYTV